MTDSTAPSSAMPRAARRRKGRTNAPARVGLAQLPWGQPRYLDAPIEPLDAEGIDKIHNAAMRILEEIGIDFLHDDAREILARAGCDVKKDSVTVRMDRALVMEQVAKAPKRIVMTPRNPDRALVFGETYAAFGLVSSPPNVSDLDHGRRVGNRTYCMKK